MQRSWRILNYEAANSLITAMLIAPISSMPIWMVAEDRPFDIAKIYNARRKEASDSGSQTMYLLVN